MEDEGFLRDEDVIANQHLVDFEITNHHGQKASESVINRLEKYFKERQEAPFKFQEGEGI